MRLTRRGLSALVIVGLAMGLAWVAGDRALNAVAAPLVGALVVGAVLVWRAPAPAVTYNRIPSGHPGDERTLTVGIDGSGLVTVSLSVPDGLAAADIDTVVSPPETIERTARLGRRGVYRLDAPDLRQRDPLGFVERRVEATAATTFVVYPALYEMDVGALRRQFTNELAAERQRFDRLREYEPGDPIKDVHWKSSAKRDDLLVMEFAAARQAETVHIAAEAATGHADEMAAAAATLVTAALDAGLSVGLTVPAGSLRPASGNDHRQSLLGLLAETDAGHLSSELRTEADILVAADSVGRTVRLADHTTDFDAIFDASGHTTEVVS